MAEKLYKIMLVYAGNVFLQNSFMVLSLPWGFFYLLNKKSRAHTSFWAVFSNIEIFDIKDPNILLNVS